MVVSPHVARALRLSTFWYLPWRLLMLSGSWPRTSLADFHEETPFRSTQVNLVRSLSSIPRVLGLWVCSSSLTTLRYPILTRTVSCLTALRGLATHSVPGFVVLLAPSLPSSCGSSRSRRVDVLVHQVVMGVSLVISLCCVLCCLLPRELLQGFWCRHDRDDVPLVRDTLPCARGVFGGSF